MAKGVASILLAMLSLQALLLAAAAAARVASGSGDDMGSLIRLPSDDAAALGKRPWKCCDMQPCTRSIPPICWCTDQLEQCSSACKECSEVTGSDPPRYICKDVYKGKPAPMCHKGQAGNQQLVDAVFAGAEEIMAVVRGSKNGGDGNGRPWKCCDKPVMAPTTGGKVVWYCKDDVKKCTCSQCYELVGNRYYCLDGYEGADPGPSCTTQA